MPEFLLEVGKTKKVRVSRNQVFFQCRFRLPEALKEKMPISQSAKVECNKVMGFYCDPVPGDQVCFAGYVWEVRSRIHHPTRRNTQDEKRVTSLELKFVGGAGNGN